MQTWTQLSRVALVGTGQQAPLPATLGDADLDQVLGKLGSVEQREAYALSAGAALTLARRSGYKPASIALATSPAPPETQPRSPDVASQFLARMLRGYLPQVLPEWLELAGSAGLRAPEELLPELLDQAKAKTELRSLAKPVLGERGAWLAAQNPDWSFAFHVSNAEKSWQEGKRPERIAALRELRQANPARGRELLAASWKDEPPEERAEFIQAFSVNLSLDDEAFLESALDDKRKEVRAGAIGLLSSLPASKLVRRMTELATPLVQIKKQLLRGTSLEISLPTECTKEMGRYGVGSSKPPNKEIGEKAWWLEEMLEVIPPSHWNQAAGLAPKELIAAALKSEWTKVLLSGWAAATSRHRERAWVQAWLEAALGKEDLLDLFPRSAVTALALAELEPLLIRLLDHAKTLVNSERIIPLITMTRQPWSKTFSQRIVAMVQDDLGTYTENYAARFRWQSFLQCVSCRVPPDLPQATSGWPKEITQNNVRETVDEFCAVIEFRRAIHRHLKGEK